MTSLSIRNTSFFKSLWNSLLYTRAHVSSLPFKELVFLGKEETKKVNLINLACSSFQAFPLLSGVSAFGQPPKIMNGSILDYSSNLPPHVRAVLERDRDDSDSDLDDFNTLSGVDSDSDKEYVDDDSGYLFTSDSDEEFLASEKSDSDVEV